MAIKVDDEWLKYALKDAVGAPITKEKLAKIKRLEWNEYRAEAGMDWGSIRDIGPLKYCVNLKELSFDGNAVSDLSPLSKLVELAEIWLVQNIVDDLTPLSNLHKLKTLVLDYNAHLRSIDGLQGLQSLSYLNIGNTGVTDITPLRELPALTKVKLYGIKNFDKSADSENGKVIGELKKRKVEVMV